MARKKLRPFMMPHPGEIFAREFEFRYELRYEPYGYSNWCQANQDRLLGEHKDRLKLLMACEIDIDQELAEALEQLMQISAQFWLNLQQNYDEWKASEK